MKCLLKRVMTRLWPTVRTAAYFYLIWSKNLSLCLNDRQQVKVLKSLNDRQSDIFLKYFKESKGPIQSKLSYVD